MPARIVYESPRKMPSVVKEVFKIVSMYTFNLPNNKELENFEFSRAITLA